MSQSKGSPQSHTPTAVETDVETLFRVSFEYNVVHYCCCSDIVLFHIISCGIR